MESKNYCGLEKERVMSKEELAAHSLEYGGFVLYPEGVEWNDGVVRHFQVDFRKLFNAPIEFRDGLAEAVYDELKNQEMPDDYSSKIVGIPAAGTTIVTDLSRRMPAARLRKEPFVYLEDAETYHIKAEKVRTQKARNPINYVINKLKIKGYTFVSNHYTHRASPEGRNNTRGKKDLFEEGSLEKGDALWLFDNVSSKNAKSKILSCNLIGCEAEYRNLVKEKDYQIMGSIVLVSNSPCAEKVHNQLGIKYASLWTTPELVNEIKKSVDADVVKIDEKKRKEFLALYAVLLGELKDLGWNMDEEAE
ncbi:MAG: hypothetical protein KAI53_05440, partial [Candidatus Aenigmarchaeota archaeon]|nr:hypothetical protein [Candidatus Aenigmarchaeota archaeon]